MKPLDQLRTAQAPARGAVIKARTTRGIWMPAVVFAFIAAILAPVVMSVVTMGYGMRMVLRGRGVSARTPRATQLLITTQPSGAAAGVADTIVMGAYKSDGVTLDTAYNKAVSLTLNDTNSTGGALAGTFTDNGSGWSGGLLTLDSWNVDLPGEYTVTASSGTLTSATSDAFGVSALGYNLSAGSLLEAYQTMQKWPASAAPIAGGTLTINSQALGSYDYHRVTGAQTVSSFSSNDWFTATADSRSAWVVADDDFTINAGQTFRPSARKLFTVIGVAGTLTVNGEISMTARGANHSAATGSNIPAAPIRIATGTFSSVTNPEVPAAGGAGAARQTATNSPGIAGTAGTAGGTGGGGGGALVEVNPSGAGGGSAGTSFCGGTGGGSLQYQGPVEDGGSDGGKGGNAAIDEPFMTPKVRGAGGGAGNPGGDGASFNGGVGYPGVDGAGGVLLIVTAGLAGSGAISADGSDGGGYQTAGGVAGSGGGASGGGSISVLFSTDSSSITPTANGGVGGDSSGPAWGGGGGGAGTARKLAL